MRKNLERRTTYAGLGQRQEEKTVKGEIRKGVLPSGGGA